MPGPHTMSRTWVVAAAACLAVGCGGSMAPSTVPRASDLGGGRSVESLLPAETTAVVHIDLASIRSSELYEVIGEDVASWGRALDRMGEEQDDEEDGAGDDGDAVSGDAPEEESLDAIDIAHATEWIVIAGIGAVVREEEHVTFLGGNLTEAQVRALARLEAEADLGTATDLPLVGDAAQLWGGGGAGAIAPPVGAPPDGGPGEPGEVSVDREQLGSRQVLAAGGMVVAPVVPGVWVVGRRDAVVDVLARFDAEPARPVATPTAELAARLDLWERDIALVARDEATRSADGDNTLDELLGQVDAVGFALDMSEGVEVRALVQATNAPAATEAHRRVRGEIEGAVREDLLGLLGLPRLLQRVAMRVDGSHLALELDLDRAEAHLWWGRISGIVGGGLLVIDWLSGFFRGFSSALGGDLPDADAPVPTGGALAGAVQSASPAAPVQDGARCTVRVIPAEDRGSQWTCHAVVECEGKPLYGGPDRGWFECAIGTAADWFVSGTDETTTSQDGDPAFTIDSLDRRIWLRDDAGGRFGEYSLEIAIDAVVPEP